MRKFALYLIIIVGISYLVPRALAKILDTPYPIAAVTSSSMWPTLKEGDLIFIRGTRGTELKEGEIVVYRNEKGFTIHRIVKLQGDRVVTKGDANLREDNPVETSDVIGKTITLKGKPLRFPYLGKISMRFNKGTNPQ